MGQLVALLCSWLALTSCAGPRPPDIDAPDPEPISRPAADYPQRFHTEANRILDAAGQTRVFHGVAVPEVVWIAQRNDGVIGYFDRRVFRTAAAWQSNIVRLSVTPALFRDAGPRETLRALDWSVAYARRYGLYLIITFHGIGFPPDGSFKSLVDVRHGELYRTDDAQILAFWRLIAQRYRSEPTVAFYELFNEPVLIRADGSYDYESRREDWVRWRDAAETLVDAIRPIDPDKPLIVGGLEFGYDLSHAAADPVRRPNIVYATHPYAGSDWKRGWADAFLDSARSVPVMATELGWGGDGHEEAMDRSEAPYRQAIFEALDRAGISWIAWSMSHSFPPSLLADPGFARTTAYGDVVRAALAAEAAGRAVTAPRPTGTLPAAPPMRLAGEALRDAISGNTETGPWGAVYYNPDGDMRTKSGDQTVHGRWRIDAAGDMCQVFPHLREGKEVCFQWLMQSGRLSTYAPTTGEGAKDGINRIEPGNSRRL